MTERIHTIALFGAGAIGEAIAVLLANSGRYIIRLADADQSRAQRLASLLPRISAHSLNLENSSSVKILLDGAEAVICALPFFCNKQVATYAHTMGIHYLDLTEDVSVTDFVTTLSSTAKSAFIPQCGLAPGYVSIVAHSLFQEFLSVDSIKLRVGALPRFPSNKLKYNRTWSTDGLVNEYLHPCKAIKSGELIFATPLEGYETLIIEGVTYEAFNTSGGIGSLCETLQGKVSTMDYKSLRYEGHRELILFLLDDLKLRQSPQELVQLFDKSIHRVDQDLCIVLVEVMGLTDRGPLQRTHLSKVSNRVIHSFPLSAIQLTTAAGICAPLDLLLNGDLSSNPGLIRLEEIPIAMFLSNEFGSLYLA